jgi:GntR family transcriptional repressor for pyruvate dehydrogenase complex
VFQPIRTLKPFQAAVTQIVEAILAGDLQVGDRLPSERALAAQMEVSRPTLREAVKVLQQAEVLEARRNGTFVRSDVIPRDLTEKRSKMPLSQVADVLEARRLFEPRIAQLAGLRATHQDLDNLQQLLELQRTHADDRDRMLGLDSRFHLSIARATHNPLVVSQARVVIREHELARDAVVQTPLDIGVVIESHERMVDAIAGGDAHEIESAVMAHLALFEHIWEEVSGRPVVRTPPEFLHGAGEPGTA